MHPRRHLCEHTPSRHPMQPTLHTLLHGRTVQFPPSAWAAAALPAATDTLRLMTATGAGGCVTCASRAVWANCKLAASENREPIGCMVATYKLQRVACCGALNTARECLTGLPGACAPRKRTVMLAAAWRVWPSASVATSVSMQVTGPVMFTVGTLLPSPPVVNDTKVVEPVAFAPLEHSSCMRAGREQCKP